MGTTYYFLPTRNLFGEDSVKETGSLVHPVCQSFQSHAVILPYKHHHMIS